MAIKLKDFTKHELVGLNIKVIDSKNKDNKGIEGKIIDETKNTITIMHKSKKKLLFKNNIKFETTIENKKIEVDGKVLAKRPEERIKR